MSFSSANNRGNVKTIITEKMAINGTKLTFLNVINPIHAFTVMIIKRLLIYMMFQFSGSNPMSNIGTGIGNSWKYRSAIVYSAILETLLPRVGKNS